MKRAFFPRYLGLFLFIFILVLVVGCGGGGGGENVYDDDDEDDSPTPPSLFDNVTIGAAGGEITERGTTWANGVKYVISAGALTEDRVFSTEYRISEERAELPDGFIPYPNKHSCDGLVVSGDKPYGLNLTIYFPFKDVTVASNEKPCAFAYDSRLNK